MLLEPFAEFIAGHRSVRGRRKKFQQGLVLEKYQAAKEGTAAHRRQVPGALETQYLFIVTPGYLEVPDSYSDMINAAAMAEKRMSRILRSGGFRTKMIDSRHERLFLCPQFKSHETK